MIRNRIACIALVAAGVFCVPPAVMAEDAISHPAKKPIGSSQNQMIPSLAVLNAKGASLQGTKLTLTGVSPNSIVFADRPVRAAGHVLTAHFIKEWDVGNDSFAKDPPNATVSVLGSGSAGVSDAVVTLKSAKLEGGNLVFEVALLEGNLDNATGPAALFIDHFGWGFHGGAYWRPRGAFYAGAAAGALVGAAAGAAAASPYPYYQPYPYYHPYAYPRCGYYPYPPCY